MPGWDNVDETGISGCPLYTVERGLIWETASALGDKISYFFLTCICGIGPNFTLTLYPPSNHHVAWVEQDKLRVRKASLRWWQEVCSQVGPTQHRVWVEIVTTYYCPMWSRNLHQGLLSWTSPIGLHGDMPFGDMGNLCLVYCLGMYLWFHLSRISSYQLVIARKESVTSSAPNMRFKAPNT